MQLEHDVSLKPFNTFGLAVKARHFYPLTDLDDLPALLQQPDYQQGPVLWLGGGSNILFTQDYPGLVIQVKLMGQRLIEAGPEQVLVEAAAGENWHAWVQATLAQGWYGLENLSLIPGTVGASPIQNLGAYGVEVKDCIHEVVCADLHHGGQQVILSKEACAFAYRDSLFKQAAGRYLVCRVRFRLSRTPKPKTGYGDIERQLKATQHWPDPSPHALSQAIVAIRSAKLPDPAILGNVGSFFKNPVVAQSTVQSLLARYPAMPFYPVDATHSKLAAGWLIEQAGLKGLRQGDAGVHTQQALVLVNHGQASGQEILALAELIQARVFQQFAVNITPEPLII